LPILADLIRETKIPNGHDQIIAAWQNRTKGMMLDEGGFGFDIVADLLEQKQQAVDDAEFKRASELSMGID
jgi:hypothetical protein